MTKAKKMAEEKEEKKGYDADLDAVVRDIGEVAGTDLYAQIRAYDSGEEKLCVYRIVGQKKPRQVQVFRLPLDEVKLLGVFMSGLPEGDDDDEEEGEE